MKKVALLFRNLRVGLILLTFTFPGGCNPSPSQPTIKDLPLYQTWELHPGSQVGGYTVTGGLGDISIVLNGNSVYAPSEGDAYLDKRGCVYFAGADTPAYMFRFCGLRSPKLGHLQAGQAIGSADTLQFAALLKQSDGKWALVEPDKSLLERTLKQQ
jgi:hypothetical protein